MKSNAFKLLNISFLSLLLMIFSSSCHKNNSISNSSMYTLSGNASGDQEVGPVTTTGSGTLSGTFDANTNTLQYTVNWTNLSGAATAAHFHGPAAAGVTSGVVIPFTINNNGNSGSATGTANVTDLQKADLIAGKWYWNVHTVAHGGGEIRGQVTATK